jgi:hypothetical protein
MTALFMGMSVYAAVLLTSETAIAQNDVESGSPSIPALEVAVHFYPATPDSGGADLEAIAREAADSLAGKIEQPVMTPPRSSIPAKWQGSYTAIVRGFDSTVGNALVEVYALN